MDLSITIWWRCADCGVDAELPVGSGWGCEAPCPDCGDAMAEQWRWDSAA